MLNKPIRNSFWRLEIFVNTSDIWCDVVVGGVVVVVVVVVIVVVVVVVEVVAVVVLVVAVNSVVVLVVVGVVLVLDLVVVVVLEVVKVEKVEKVVNRALDSDSFEGRYWVEVDGEMMLSSSDFTAGCKFSYSVVIASLSSILVVVLVVVLLDSFVLCGDVVITKFDNIGSVLMSLWDSGRLTVRLLDSRISLGGVMTSLFQVETETLPGITMKTKTMQDTALNTARRRDRKNEI